MKEHRVGVRELKANLSSVLRGVKAGKAVVITERGKPVGRIVPADASTEEALQEGFATYDRRLRQAARAAGLLVFPGKWRRISIYRVVLESDSTS